ncbi:hypothetical protein [Haladaptatus sp. CMAA 1911]|uniref:hypothetical protein n=1 Tax=unclassified Haladaptatus TaxID=2622732 RepID=UPI003754A6AE
MSTSSSKLRVNQPVGGYVITALFALITVAMPVGAVLTILEGDIVAGILMVVLGIPMFGWITYQSRELTTNARTFRAWLRAEHHWLSSVGIFTRLAGIAVVVLAAVVDLFILHSGEVIPEVTAVVGLLVAFSAFSVLFSCIGQRLMPGA